jgi:hypothetical protein
VCRRIARFEGQPNGKAAAEKYLLAETPRSIRMEDSTQIGGESFGGAYFTGEEPPAVSRLLTGST